MSYLPLVFVASLALAALYARMMRKDTWLVKLLVLLLIVRLALIVVFG